VAFGYTGTVTFRVTDPDPAVVLPLDYTFTADRGVSIPGRHHAPFETPGIDN